LYVAVRECCRFNCKHLICVHLFSESFHCTKLMYLLMKVAMFSSLCSVYTLLSRHASLDSSCSVKNDSHIFSPSCCTGYNSYSLYICADLWVLCSPSLYVLLHTKGTFPRPCNLDVCVCMCVCVYVRTRACVRACVCVICMGGFITN